MKDASTPESAELLAVSRLFDGDEPFDIESQLIGLGHRFGRRSSVQIGLRPLQRYRRSTAGKSTLLRSNNRKIVLGLVLAVLAVAITAFGQFSTRGEWHLRFDSGPIVFGGVFGLLAVACVATGCSPLLRSRHRPTRLQRERQPGWPC